MAYISQFLSECVEHILHTASNILTTLLPITGVAVLLFMCVTNEINAQNQVITDFPGTSFYVNERPLGNYEPISGNRHRLTRKIWTETTIICCLGVSGNGYELDLSKYYKKTLFL